MGKRTTPSHTYPDPASHNDGIHSELAQHLHDKSPSWNPRLPSLVEALQLDEQLRLHLVHDILERRVNLLLRWPLHSLLVCLPLTIFCTFTAASRILSAFLTHIALMQQACNLAHALFLSLPSIYRRLNTLARTRACTNKHMSAKEGAL